MGKIIINGLRIFAYHGANPEEKENGQIFGIDLELSVNTDKACISDSLGDTVSYAAVIKTVKRVMAAGRDNLIERAAWRIAEGVMLEHEQVEALCVTLKKPDAPISADFDYVAVKLELTRADVLGDEADAGEDEPEQQEPGYSSMTGRYYTAQELADEEAEEADEEPEQAGQQVQQHSFTFSPMPAAPEEASESQPSAPRRSVWDNDSNPFSIR